MNLSFPDVCIAENKILNKIKYTQSQGNYGRNIYIADKSIKFAIDVGFDQLIGKKYGSTSK